MISGKTEANHFSYFRLKSLSNLKYPVDSTSTTCIEITASSWQPFKKAFKQLDVEVPFI